MIVVCLSDCPPKVRGDITQWLMEVNTGVYVGNLSARVRDELWERICKNIGSGRATMVFSAAGEQKMRFYVHNTPWEAVDYDGLTFMRRPLPGQVAGELPRHFSNAAHRQMRKHTAQTRHVRYCVVDLETTGLSPEQDEILEIGAIKICDGEIEAEFQRLISSKKAIPEKITELTGITEAERNENSVDLPAALRSLSEFVADMQIVSHNAAFDSSFLHHACKRCDILKLQNQFADTMILAKRRLKKLRNYKLQTIAQYYGIDEVQQHRALPDCKLTAQVYEKLNGRTLEMFDNDGIIE